MNDMKRNFIKLLTTDCKEIEDNLIDKLSTDFADILDIEGCVDKTIILQAKQLAGASNDVWYTSILSNSNISRFMTLILKNAVKKLH